MTTEDATPIFARQVKCPRCGGDSVYAPSNPARPFCSERCKNIDFGDWSSEAFRMPAPVTSADQDDAADSLPH
jgi:endogenous inhibitor of DNA gyrase (YacG/DUF329 family)